MQHPAAMCGWMDVYIIRTHMLPQSRAMTYVRLAGWVRAYGNSWLKVCFHPASRIIVHWAHAFSQAESNWTYWWRTTANTNERRRLDGFNDTIPFDFILTFHAFLFHCHFYLVAFAARIGATICVNSGCAAPLVAFGRCQTHLIAPHIATITHHSRIEIEKMW